MKNANNKLVKLHSNSWVIFEGFLLNSFNAFTLAKVTGEHLCQSLYFNKVADVRPATLLEERLVHRCFPVNFVNFSERFFTEHLWTAASIKLTPLQK